MNAFSNARAQNLSTHKGLFEDKDNCCHERPKSVTNDQCHKEKVWDNQQ